MTNEKCLVVIEVSQKQRYIFCSNRLRENIGASIVIAKMTEEVPKEAFKQYVEEKRTDLGILLERCRQDTAEYIEQNLVSNGGGKSIYSFDSEDEADQFIKITSIYIIKNYFGVEVFFAKQVYDSEIINEIDAVHKLYENLKEEKSGRRSSFRLYGIGLNEKCPSTALPVHLPEEDTDMPTAIKNAAKKYRQILINEAKKKDAGHKIDTYGKDGFNLSVYTKLAAAEEQKAYFKKPYLPVQYSNEYDFPYDLDKLGGSKNEKNMIAVLVADGNGMGKRIESIRKELRKNHREQEYLSALRQFSHYIEQVYQGAIMKVVENMCDNWDKLRSKLSLQEEGTVKYLPIRPLIAAGDDICLITDARIGLSAMVCLLEEINKISIGLRKKEMNQKNDIWFEKAVSQEGLFASGGIVFCKEKYPFSRAHDLAESLCHNAKKMLKNESGLEDASMIDFHIAMGELDASIEEERSRRSLEKNVKTVKPYVLGHTEYSYTFENFKCAMSKIKDLKDNLGQEEKDSKKMSQEEEKTGIGKIKELAYYIRQGNDVAESFINQSSKMKDMIYFKKEGEDNATLKRSAKEFYGIDGDYTIFLDAIEMLDLCEEIGGERKSEVPD